jgi:hypothetical protein
MFADFSQNFSLFFIFSFFLYFFYSSFNDFVCNNMVLLGHGLNNIVILILKKERGDVD